MDVDAVREHVRGTHGEVLVATARAADAVAAGWDGNATTDGDAVRRRLRTELDERDVPERLPTVLRDAASVAGLDLAADPVAAPPYVAATSRGPVARATTDAGRLVIRIEVFEVRRDPVRYVRVSEPVEESLSVTLR